MGEGSEGSGRNGGGKWGKLLLGAWGNAEGIELTFRRDNLFSYYMSLIIALVS